MNWGLTVALCALLVEAMVRMPLARPLRRLVRTSTRAVHVVTATAVSDHWKEKAMRSYARATFTSTIQIAGCFALWLGLAAALVIGFEHLSSNFRDFLLSWVGIGFSLIVGGAYAVARRGLVRG